MQIAFYSPKEIEVGWIWVGSYKKYLHSFLQNAY